MGRESGCWRSAPLRFFPLDREGLIDARCHAFVHHRWWPTTKEIQVRNSNRTSIQTTSWVYSLTSTINQVRVVTWWGRDTSYDGHIVVIVLCMCRRYAVCCDRPFVGSTVNHWHGFERRLARKQVQQYSIIVDTWIFVMLHSHAPFVHHVRAMIEEKERWTLDGCMHAYYSPLIYGRCMRPKICMYDVSSNSTEVQSYEYYSSIFTLLVLFN